MSEIFREWDRTLLHWINVDWAMPALDPFWLAITHLERQHWFTWFVLPALLVWLVYIYRSQAIKPLLALGLTVGISDLLAYRVVKALVQRARPFENPAVAEWVRHIGDAHGASFPSNHAANSFAGAVILAFYFPRLRSVFYILAVLIAISRIALGVHFPSDVAAGAILGISVGLVVRFTLLSRVRWFRLENSVSVKDTHSSR